MEGSGSPCMITGSDPATNMLMRTKASVALLSEAEPLAITGTTHIHPVVDSAATKLHPNWFLASGFSGSCCSSSSSSLFPSSGFLSPLS